MGIDPFTVVAQVVNFLILVALLKRFLYAPVIHAMDQREERVAARLEEAADARRNAEAEAERLRSSNAELEAAREGILAEARAHAEERRHELVALAREDTQRQRERWREAIEREKEVFLEELERRVLERVRNIARRALHDLADEDLEQTIARAFLHQLEALDPDVWTQALAQHDEEGPASFLVTSAFPLPDETRSSIGGRIRELGGEDAVVRFAVHPETIAGIELRAHGLRAAWSLGDFVDSLEDLFPVATPIPAGKAIQ